MPEVTADAHFPCGPAVHSASDLQLIVFSVPRQAGAEGVQATAFTR